MRVLADACRDPGLRSLFTSPGRTKDAADTGAGDVYKKLAAQVTIVALLVWFLCSLPPRRPVLHTRESGISQMCGA